MDKQELIKRLKELENSNDRECSHIEADCLLIEYINNKEIKGAYGKLEKWYN